MSRKNENTKTVILKVSPELHKRLKLFSGLTGDSINKIGIRALQVYRPMLKFAKATGA